MADEKKPSCPEADVVAVGPVLPNGDIAFIRHKSDHSIEGGTLSPVVEGKAPSGNGEVLLLKHREGNQYDVTEVAKGDGPAMVNSSAFRSNWDNIFGGRQTVGQA